MDFGWAILRISDLTQNISSIWIRPEKSSFFRKFSYEPVQLTTGPLSFSDPVLSKDGKKLFVMGQQTRRSEERRVGKGCRSRCCRHDREQAVKGSDGCSVL